MERPQPKHPRAPRGTSFHLREGNERGHAASPGRQPRIPCGPQQVNQTPRGGHRE